MEFMLGVFGIQDANRIQALFKNKDIILEQRFNDQTCRSGCGMTVELWASEKDQAAVLEFFQAEAKRDLAGLDINTELMNQVFDPNADQVTCQACGFKFSPSANVCPDCGLHYG